MNAPAPWAVRGAMMQTRALEADMGIYVNPGNRGFADIVRDGYVDKTGLIVLVNEAVGTSRKLVCPTRPRRFGKSFAVASLVA